MDEDSDSEHETESEQPQRARTKSNEVLYVGDKIQLANKRKGKVTSIGPKQDKEGIWVRVLMDTQSHGSPDNMFNENSKKSKAIWVPIQRVDRVLTRGGKFNLTVDDRVIERKKNIPGIIKYVGPTHFDKVCDHEKSEDVTSDGGRRESRLLGPEHLNTASDHEML